MLVSSVAPLLIFYEITDLVRVSLHLGRGLICAHESDSPAHWIPDSSAHRKRDSHAQETDETLTFRCIN